MGKYVKCKELTTGNINNTYRVDYVRDGQDKSYILQKINKSVFLNPEKVMENIVKVTDCVREKLNKKGLSTKKMVLRAFENKEDGKPFVVDDLGEYWRCYRFIQNSETYDTSESLVVIERVGQAFGRFQNCLDGFDAQSLFITIPNFHNTTLRYQTFEQVVKKDAFDRVKLVKEEIATLNDMKEMACILQAKLDSGEIPLRVTHNDTKCNNVSFDKTTHEALAVLDLDTVMPGAIAYDFGDAIRFIANTVIEDDPDVDKVRIDLDKYEAFTKGFVTEVQEKLTEEEKKTLNLGVFTMTVELSVRFLTDYLEGDKYFKTRYPGHNVDRVRNQIALAKDILKKQAEMDKIIKKYL
jgi:Ser/Thr protein kinase RdoA (MazF antagonist)